MGSVKFVVNFPKAKSFLQWPLIQRCYYIYQHEDAECLRAQQSAFRGGKEDPEKFNVEVELKRWQHTYGVNPISII